MNYPEIIQGTDGIRRQVNYNSQVDPIGCFFNENTITPKFAEMYAYAVVKWIKDKFDRDKLNIGLGYDPRDRNKKLVEAVTKGLKRGGACVFDTGIVPSPLLPIYSVYKDLDASLMITASHNPPDQNGIKIFLKYGIKPFPSDDAEITAKFYDLFVYRKTDIDSIEAEGKYINVSDEAMRVFKDFMKNRFNSWMEESNNIDFSKYHVILDCANGSYSLCASDILKELGFKNIIETASNLNNDVNMNSGVVDLESFTVINNTHFDCRFMNANTTVEKIFDMGIQLKDKLINEKHRLCAFVFDADGDRFYRLDYNPYDNSVIVLSGDENAVIQARYYKEIYSETFKGSSFVSTIESDYNVYLTAKDMGFESHLTGVGDKWLLRRCFIDLLEAYDNGSKIKENDSAFDIINSLDMLSISIGSASDLIVKLNFAVGSEESGHNISLGVISNEKQVLKPVFAGNGLKSAVNSFVAIEGLFAGLENDGYYRHLQEPFIRGYKKTYYVYYTNKSKLYKPKYRDEFKEQVNLFIDRKSNEGIILNTDELKIPEEPSAIFLKLYTDNKEIGCIFTRNSGTEDKTAVYIRCGRFYKDLFNELGNLIYLFTFRMMKDHTHKYAIAERNILDIVNKNGSISDEQFRSFVSLDGINIDRLRHEMLNKEKIIFAKDGRLYPSTDEVL